MKQHLRILLSASFVVLVLGFTATPVSADEPGVSTAIDLLQSAKKSDKPLPILHEARKHLKSATGIKGSVRLEAQQLIKAAIAEAETGDKSKMEQKVNAAIAKIHKGVGKAK